MLEYLLEGGWIMAPLAFLSVLSLAIIIDRWRAFVKTNEETTRVRKQVSDCLDEGDLAAAIEACQTSPSPLAAVMLTGLDKYRKMMLKGHSVVEMENVVSKVMEDYAPRAMAVLEKRFNLLVLVASVSPLLGITGTVIGMIVAFDNLPAGNTAAVASGIAQALLTTAGGLLVAMPAIVAYNLYTKRADNYLLIMEEMISDVVSFISERSG